MWLIWPAVMPCFPRIKRLQCFYSSLVIHEIAKGALRFVCQKPMSHHVGCFPQFPYHQANRRILGVLPLFPGITRDSPKNPRDSSGPVLKGTMSAIFGNNSKFEKSHLPQWKPINNGPVLLMHQSIPAAPIPPPRANPRALALFLFWVENSRGWGWKKRANAPPPGYVLNAKYIITTIFLGHVSVL